MLRVIVAYFLLLLLLLVLLFAGVVKLTGHNVGEALLFNQWYWDAYVNVREN